MSKYYRCWLILRLNYKKLRKILINLRRNIELNVMCKCCTEFSGTVLKSLLMVIKFSANKIINNKIKMKINKFKYKINVLIKNKKSYLNHKIKISGFFLQFKIKIKFIDLTSQGNKLKSSNLKYNFHKVMVYV